MTIKVWFLTSSETLASAQRRAEGTTLRGGGAMLLLGAWVALAPQALGCGSDASDDMNVAGTGARDGDPMAPAAGMGGADGALTGVGDGEGAGPTGANDGAQSGNGMQPDGMQPDGMQPDGMQPDGMQPDGMQPDGMQP
ncbi:MAG: hypothetical protein OXU20_08925, partial [Myxococcales bacterium]|nr:hypothetical protein [Myxococcales bacterium]